METRDYRKQTHGGIIRLVDHCRVWRSAREQSIIDLAFSKLARGDVVGLERTLKNRSVASLRQRGVLTVEREQ